MRTSIPAWKGPPACPKCKGVMSRRKALKGAFAGKFFWGCTKFPDCKGVIDIIDEDQPEKQIRIATGQEAQAVFEHFVGKKGSGRIDPCPHGDHPPSFKEMVSRRRKSGW